jgi:hypothetical protein
MIFRIAALGIGALAAYYFDPASGKRRRAVLRERLVQAKRRVARSRRKLDIDLTQDLGR